MINHTAIDMRLFGVDGVFCSGTLAVKLSVHDFTATAYSAVRPSCMALNLFDFNCQ